MVVLGGVLKDCTKDLISSRGSALLMSRVNIFNLSSLLSLKLQLRKKSPDRMAQKSRSTGISNSPPGRTGETGGSGQ